MIGALKGTVFSKSQTSIILFAGNVGYIVFIPNRYLEKIKPEEEIFLNIHSHIREDAFDLFGFPDIQELRLFELLLTVSGIGPKTALSIVDRGVMNVTEAVQKSDVNFFTTIPRLGKKNAQKIIIELKTKLGSLSDLDLSDMGAGETKELTDALSTFGFPKYETLRVIKTVPDDIKTLEDKIRFCLKQLGKSL